jgi:flagellum-specific ATP synthase
MGSNPEIDQAIALRSQLEAFLVQDMHTEVDHATTRQNIRQLLGL